MRFFSKKTRGYNKKSLFRALKQGSWRFVVAANTLRALQRSLSQSVHGKLKFTCKALTLLLVIILGIFGVHPAFSQESSLEEDLSVESTLLIYPSAVGTTSWSGIEHVLTPDLDEDALYQEFNARNSAYVPLHAVVIDDVEITPSVGESGTDESSTESSVVENPMQDEVLAQEPVGASSTNDVIEVQDDDAVGAGSGDPEPVEPVETEPVLQEPESVPEVQEQEVFESEAEPEPVSEEVEAQEPVVIKKATASLFAFFSTVSELFPFVNTIEEVPLNETEETVATEQDPASGMQPEPEFQTQTQEQVQTDQAELITPETQAIAVPTKEATSTPQPDVVFDAGTASSSQEVETASDTDGVSSLTPQQEQTVSVSQSSSHSLMLHDFSAPDLERGEFITSMQLRLSLGGSYDIQGSSSLPVVDIVYLNGSTTEQVGSIVLDGEVSNAINGGYFLFALPQITHTRELSGASIELVYRGDTEHLDGLYVDSAWLEIHVERLDKKKLLDRLYRDLIKRFSEPELYTIISEQKDFTSDELPHFSLKYNSQRNIVVRFLRDLFGRQLAEVENVAFVHKDVGNVGIEPEIYITDDGLLDIQLEEEDKDRLRPGEYTVEITVNEGGNTYTDTFNFQWGLLSINPDQTTYALGDIAHISMGALSPNGNTICDADLSLFMIDPEDVLTKVAVEKSGLCNGNNVVDVPDYFASFVPPIAGTYEMYLERTNSDGTIAAHTVDTFIVKEAVAFELTRNGPSRIFPKAVYPMEITLSSKNDWNGVLIETVPASFEISSTSATITETGETLELSWNVSLLANEEKTFSYTFNAPDISPFLYTVGTARLEGTPLFNETEEVIATSTASSSNAAVDPAPVTSAEAATGTIDEIEEVPNVPSTETEAETQHVDEPSVVQPTPEFEIEFDQNDTTELGSVPEEATSTEVPLSEETQVLLPEPDVQEQVLGSVSSSVIFEEHRKWQIASDATGNLIVFFDSAAAVPAGWTCLSCGSGVFYQRIPMGSSTYNTTGGATTHTHTASAVVNTSNTVNTENSGTGEISIPSHTHLYTPTISSESNLPAYRQFRVIQSNNAGDPSSIPAGAIMMFDDASLPSGWTRLSALDDRYPRGENSIANGGSNTHTHSVSGNTSAASNLSTDNSRFGGTQVSGAADNHAHTVSGSTASQSIEPSYIEVVFATAAGATSTPVGALAMWSDTPPAQWLDRSSDPSSPFSNRYFKGATTYGTTGGASEHAPADVSIVSGAASITDNARSGTTGNSAAHTHVVDVTGFSTTNHLPPYITVIIGKKFGPIPMYTQLAYRLYVNADSATPTDPWPAGGDDLLENEPITAEMTAAKNGDVVRLRMQLNVGNSTSTSEAFKLQFATTTAACTAAGSWTDVGSATSSVVWRGYNNTTPSDGVTLGSTLITGSDVLGSYEEQNPSVTMPNTVGIGQDGEWDFVVQQNNAEAETIYCFRMVESDGTPLFAYTEYPTITTSSAPEAPTLSKPFDNQKTASTTPYFEFTTSDAEGNDVSYQIQVDNDYDFSSTAIDSNSEASNLFENLNTSADKDPFTNGASIRFNNSTSLSNNTTYYWRVRAKDPNGSNQWGSWSTIKSFTVDTSVTVSTWFQTTDEQFNTNTLDRVEGVSDQAQLVSGSTTGSMWSDSITFSEGDVGTAWGEFSFNDTETSSDLKYTVQYLLDDVWTNIPDSDLSGNAAGFDTSPVSLLGVDKTTYSEIRIEANFTDSGASPSVQDWTVSWDYLIETPTIITPFANEKVGTTTPVFQFQTTDPQNDDLVYQIQWSTSYDFSASTTRSSDVSAGFSNLDDGADTSPFTSGDTIQFQLQAADALSNNTTYWWRVRARDPLGDNTYSFFTDPRSFTVDTTVTVATWFQTTQEQFDHDVLSGALTQGGGTVTVATTSDESMVVYAEGTVTTPRYREWDGSSWSTEADALDVGASINWVVTKAAPNRNEYITGTLSSDSDINVQVFQNGSWGNLNEVTPSAANVNMRGFDIAYEQSSGDALVVYCDGDEDPSYEIWDGSSWTSGGSINFTSGVACGWIRMASDPFSDEIILVARNTTGTEYTAWVWDGSSWGDNVTGGSMTEEYDEGIAIAYEDSGDQAVIAISNGGSANFAWRAWNGSSWTSSATVALGDDFEWGSIVADDGSDNMAICYIDNDNDVGVVRWNGSAWTGQTELDTGGNAKADRAVDCAFEVGGSRDGYIMVAYSDTAALRYRSWNGATWAVEASITTITDSATVQLRRTGANLLQVLAYDDVNDRYDYSDWNGSSWSARQALETNGSSGAAPFKEPFMIAPRNPGIEATVIGAPLIDFDDGSGPYFETMSWNDSEPGSSGITYQVEYYDGDSWELVPDLLIPGNSTGTSTSPLDLSGMLPVSTYNTIRPVANLLCVGGSCPSLSDWTITWAEGITVSGTALAYDQSANLTSGSVAVAVNGTIQTGKTGTIATGAWSIANVNVSPGDIVTVFISGASDDGEAVAVTVYDGIGDITGLNLFERHLSVGSDDNATVHNVDLELYDFTNTEDIFFDVDGNNDLDLCVSTGCTDAELYIKAGNTFQPGSGGNVTTHSFENNGTFLPNGNTIRIGGSWDNNATTSMATSSVIFTATTTDTTATPWYNSSWGYRTAITIQASEVDASLTDFPVYVGLSALSSTFFNNVRSDGGDIRVTTADGTTEVPREIVSIDTGADTGEIYFRADSVSSSTDTTFYIYYGNAGATDYAVGDTYGRNAVWSNAYEAVYHMEEDPSSGAPQYIDSTGNSSGTATNMEGADQVVGIAGNAADVDGANESIQTNVSQSMLDSTWSLFLNTDGTQGACDGAMFSRGTGVNGMNVGACGNTGLIGYHWENLAGTAWNWTGGPSYPTDEWFMASLVIEPTQATAYAHTGSSVSSGSNVQTHATSTIDNLDFGWDSFGVARSFDGTIDEARLSTVARSVDWLDAEYRNIASSSTFYAIGSTLTYASSTGTPVPYTLDDTDGTLDFYNVTFGESSGASEWALQDTLDVDHALTVAYGTLVRGSYAISVAGNLATLANGLWSGIGTTTFDGSGASTWSDSSSGLQNIGNTVIDGTSKVLTLGSNTKAQSITIGANDTFDLAPANYDVTVFGNWVNNNTFNVRSGDVIFAATSTGHVITAGGDAFYTINFNGVGGGWSFTESTLTVSSNFVIATGTVTMPTATTTISGSFTNSGGTFAHNNGLVYFTGSGSKTITVSGGQFTNAFYDTRFTGSGSWAFQDAATTSNTFRITQGSVTFPASTLTIGGNFIKSGGSFAHNNGTVVFLNDGLHSITAGGSNFNNVTIRFPGVGGTWYSPSWDYRIPITIPAGAVSEDLIDFPVYVDLSTLGSSFFSDVKADGGDIRITQGDGSTEVPREIVSIDTGSETGELYFRGTVVSSTSTTFYIYYGNAAANNYTASSTYGAQNVWSNGYVTVYHFEEDPSASAPQYVDSTGNSAGTSANMEGADQVPGLAGNGAELDGIDEVINTTFSQTLSESTWSLFLDTDGTQAACDSPMFSRGGGGDTSGMNLGACGDNTRIGYHWNDSAASYNWAGGPVYPTNEWFMASLVVEASEATAYEHSQNGSSSGVNTTGHGNSDINNLVFGHDPTASRYFDGTIDEARLSLVARSAGWLDATYTNYASSTTFFATSSVETLSSGRTFADTNASILGDLLIQSGVIQFPTGTLSVGGSFDNDGTISHNDGTVLFNSTDIGETVDLGGSSLYNMTFNSATGGWTITSNATTSNDTTLTAGSFTLNSGLRLAVLGEFQNDMQNASTTWTGSTLSLEGNSYTINSKSNAGDTYETLRIAANTDVKMWNSSAGSYTVDPSGSLYSQDHAGVDGDLYIFGNYPRSSGTEYWSYATDFDGTALGGGSRQANVRFAADASASLSNSTLNITGSPSATTTIENQGSGTYAVTVTGGTTTASHYAFDDLGLNGVSLLLGNDVTTLSYGSFISSVSGGTGLRVASTTIGTNPGLQIFNVEFATTSAISAFNVTQTGANPSSYWWFRSSYGNLDGEAFDNDTGDPGSVRWDDSSLVFNVSGTVYQDDGATPLVGGTCDGATNSVRLVVENGATYDTSCSNVDGTFTFVGVTSVGDPTLTLFLNNASGGEQAVTVTKTPTDTIAGLDLYANRVITRHEDTAAMTIADMGAYDSTDDADVLFTVSTVPDALTVAADTELFVWASTTFTPGGTVTLTGGGTGNPYDGSLHLDDNATFTGVGTTTYTIGGSFIVDDGATFVSASTTVIMNATTSGKAISVATSTTANFNVLRFTGVNGGWNINGDIEATDDIEVATGTVTGTGDIDLLFGSIFGDGVLSLGGGTTTIQQSNTLGGSESWTFYNLSLGNGLVVGTTTPASAATTTIGGVLTINTAHFLDAGSSAFNLSGTGTVFLEQGTFLEDMSTVRYSGTAATNILSTGYYNLILDALAGSPTYTATGLGIAVAHDLTVGGSNTTTVNINTNDTALDVNGDVFIASNGTFESSNSGAFTLAGNWDNDGTFTSNGGTVTFDGAGASTVAPGTSAFGSVLINQSGSISITEHATATGAFNVATTTGFTLANGQILAVGGTFTNAQGGGVTTWTGSTLSLYGGGNYQINTKAVSDTYEVLMVAADTDIRMWNSSASSYTIDPAGSLYSQDHAGVDGDLYIYGNYPGNGGTDYWSYATDFDGTALGGGSRQADVRFASGASMSLYSGGLQVLGTAAASTTIQNQGSGTYSLVIGGTASTSWSYYDLQNMASGGLTFTGTPQVVSLSRGDFEISQNGGSGITVGGSVLDANPAKTFTNNGFATTTGITGYNVTATGTAVSSWRFTNHYGNLDGEAFDSDPDGDPGYIVWDDSAASITISGNVYSDEGTTVSTVCDSTTNNIHIRVAGLTSYTTSCNGDGLGGGTGFYSMNGITYSPGDSIVVYIDGETQKGANVTADPVSNIANMHIFENRVIVRHENTDPLSIADMAVWDSSDDADIPFTAVDSSPDTLTLPSDRKLIVWNNKTFAPGGNVTLTNGGSQAYGGTLELRSSAVWTSAGTESHAIGGSLIADAGALFTPANSTTTFTTSGASRTIDINNGSFYNVAFTGSGSWTISDAIFDINAYSQTNGTLTLPSGTTTVSAGWNKTSGSFIASGPFVFDGTGSHAIGFGGSDAGPLYFTGSGTFTMTDTNATSTGGLTKSNGSLSLPSGVLALSGSFDNQSGTITHNTSLIAIATSSSAFIRASSSDLYGVQFQGGGTYTFADDDLTLLDDLSLRGGAMTLASGTLSIGGSFDAQNGTFNHASGTVLFNSTDTGETVDPGNSSFYNAVFQGSGGGWTMSASATTTNNFSLTLGSSYTQAAGTTLYVGGVFTNAIGGSGTTWSNSSLILDSGSNYSINTKTSGGDHYQTLVVGDNTDIRAWNSRATTTTVADSGSFYSQDHAGVNGALNIYGDFHIATTTEYWSYATDFDGTSLSGSERAVTVSIAQNATTTVDGGTLRVIGASGNSTTVTNQGSGTYALQIEGGTFNALYYAMRNLNVDGLLFSGTPTITSLSEGDFELAVDGGSLISLASTTLDANASKIISGMRFATTTAITGYNVNLTGSTSNAWSFVSHTGNLSGEDFDNDGVTACGSLRWSDSSCLLTQQTHYRWRNDDGGLDVPNTEWFDSNWDSRIRVRLDSSNTTAVNNAVVKLEVPYDADMQVDFEDLRFTDNSGTTSIPYFIERYSASSDATVWVQVPTLAAEDITTIFMYFENASTTSQSSSTETFIAADDFEDGDISEYSGNTSLFAVDSSFAYGGSYGLDTTGHESDKADDGIARFDQTVSQGETIRFLQYIDTSAGSGDEVCTLFGVQSPVTANQNYAVCLEQFGVDRISLVRDAQNTDTSGTVLASSTVTYSTGWYEVEINWQTDDDIEVALRKDGSDVATISDNDGTYTSGGIGFTFWFQNGGWDNYTSRVHVDTEPTVYFGAKQTDGGASWASNLDTYSTYSQGDVARLRLAVENTGLQITNQTFDLEYALKGAAPSCEAVASANYDPVPVQASCGSSPLCMASTTYFGDDDATTDLLFDTEGTFTGGRAVEDPSFTTSALTIDQDEYTELEYALVPTVNASSPSYCLRVTDGGDPVDTYLSVAELQLRFDPVVTNVTLNAGSDISLLPGATTTVYATGTVSDQNGYTDLSNATSTIYRSGAGAACSADNNNCYISTSPLCTFTNCSGNSCTVSCQADIYFHADATDASPYEGEEWLALIEVSDQNGGIDIAAVPAGVELLSLQALDVTAAINYGSLSVSSSTGAYNPTTTVANLGNVSINIQVEGTDLTDGGTSAIPTEEQLFATTTFTYETCTTCNAVSSTSPVSLDVDLSKPTTATPPVTDVVYWGIYIPFGIASNPHTGTNIFYAVSE